MTDRTLFRILGTGALVIACGLAGRAGFGIALNDAGLALNSGLASALAALLAVLLFAIEGSDDGID